jgi:hypothetical protein
VPKTWTQEERQKWIAETRCKKNKPSLLRQLKSGLLGDVTETILTSVGLTKQKWQEIIGGPCGCGERQAWLNKVGQALMNTQTPSEE